MTKCGRIKERDVLARMGIWGTIPWGWRTEEVQSEGKDKIRYAHGDFEVFVGA